MQNVAWTRLVGKALLIQFVLLFAAGAWLRLFCLEAFPYHYADESHFGLQVVRILQGRPFELHVSSGNAVGYLLMAMQLPLHMVFEPSLALLRIPAVVSGLLAVLMVGWMGRKVLDPTTGLIGSMLLATLPVTIVFSRVAISDCQTPLVGAIAAYFAFRGHGPGLFLTALTSLLVHPTNIFLIPIWLPVYLVRAVQARDGDRKRQARAVAAALLGVLAIVVPFALLIRGNAHVSRLANDTRDPLLFLVNFCRFLVYNQAPGQPASAHVAALATGVSLVLLGVGAPSLIRRRQWDRLALVVGFLGGMAAFDLKSGATVLASDSTRYGAVLVVPTALAVACLVRAMLPASLGPDPLARHGLRFAGIAAVGWALLLAAHSNFFHYHCTSHQNEWVFHFRTPDGYKQALKTIVRDANRRSQPAGSGSQAARPACRIVTQEHFFDGLIFDYLTSWDRDVSVESLADLRTHYATRLHEPGVFDPQKPRLQEALEAGGYVVAGPGPDSWGGAWLSAMIESTYPPDRIQSWTTATVGGPWVRVYRLKPEAATPLAGTDPERSTIRR